MTVFHKVGEDGALGERVEAEVSREFLERIPGGLFRYRADAEGRLDYVSADLVAMYDCETEAQFRELTGNGFPGMIHPADRERVLSAIDEQIALSDTDRVIYRINRADPSKGELWVDDCGRKVTDDAGVEWYYVTLIDVTQTMAMSRELNRSHERQQILSAISNDVIFDIDCRSGHCQVYGDFRDRFGRDPKQCDFVVQRRCKKECNLDIEVYDLEQLIADISPDSFVDVELSTPGPDGDPIWYRYQSVVLFDEDHNPVRHVGRLLDTHEMSLRESQFRRKAERDGLTGIYNRAAAVDRVDTALLSSERPCTLVLIDVDDFKSVNDTYGHPEGDRVLTVLADFLRQAMRKEDVVARLGGDEFAVFAEGLGPGPALDRILDHLARGPFAAQRETDGAEVEDDGEHAAPTISIGAVCCTQPPTTFDKLYAEADDLLYNAKEAGKAQFVMKVLD